MSFYEKLAPLYDEMINFSERIKSEEAVFRNLFKRFPAESVLDAGCGTGLHGIIYSRLNKKVTGFDPSEEMLKIAEQNSKKFVTNVRFLLADFETFIKIINEKFDSIYCLGNSFVHLLSKDNQLSVLKSFTKSLNNNGYLFLQILNYNKILHFKKSVISKKKYESYTFNRFYTFNEKTVNFNIDVQHPTDSFKISTELYPLTSEDLFDLGKSAGFSKIHFFGNMQLEEFKQFESESICVYLSN